MGSDRLRRAMLRPLGLAVVAILAPPALPAAHARGGPPSRPSDLAVTNVKPSAVRLVWMASEPGGARIGDYRVYRDGHPFKRVRGLSLRVRVSSDVHAYQVAAADIRGRVGPRSRPVRVLSGHRPPARPGRLRATRVTESEVRLSWSPSRRRSGRIAGYRIYRNGIVVRQVHGRTGSDDGLAPATRYRFAIAPIDTQGYLGPSTGAVKVRTAMPLPTRGRAHAFLLASTDSSFRDLQLHYRQIGTVYPTYFDCRLPDGSVTGRDDPLVTRWSQLRRIRVLPRFNCQDPATVHAIVADPQVRSATLSRLTEIVRRYGYDGLNLDLENGDASDRDALTAFASELADRLHALDKELSIAVSAKYEPTTTGRSGLYDYEALGAVADRVFVMNWGWHWLTSEPGAPDDLELCRKVADYVASMPNRGRFVLGTNMYGTDWPNGGGPSNKATPLEFADVGRLIARYGAAPLLDPAADAWTFAYTDQAGVHHEVWYPDAATIAKRVRLARERGLGVGFWRLGREDQRVWDDVQIAAGSSWP